MKGREKAKKVRRDNKRYEQEILMTTYIFYSAQYGPADKRHTANLSKGACM